VCQCVCTSLRCLRPWRRGRARRPVRVWLVSTHASYRPARRLWTTPAGGHSHSHLEHARVGPLTLSHSTPCPLSSRAHERAVHSFAAHNATWPHSHCASPPNQPAARGAHVI
jgi:hypothetical protein